MDEIIKSNENNKLKNNSLSNSNGITLIALIITVIIMLILAGVIISESLFRYDLFTKTRIAIEEHEKSAKEEFNIVSNWQAKIDGYLSKNQSNSIENGGNSEIEEPNDEDNGEDNGEDEGEDESEVIPPIDSDKLIEMTDGSWNGEVNTPKLITGMIPIYWDNGVEIELTEDDPEEKWNNWFSYTEQISSTETTGSGTSKWANAVTKNNGEDNISGNEDDEITGYWVWIPRFEYYINEPSNNSESGEIEVNFIKNESVLPNYKVHPAFTNNTENGGWTNNIPGFWVSKYPAGFQASTVPSTSIGTGTLTFENGTDTIEFSDLKYTTPGNDIVNAIGQNLGETNFANERISYPVFKPLTCAYNYINVDSSFRISKQVVSASAFYGLSNGDSHQMKNSEWGAVAYLTWSQYGRNATEPNINNININNYAKNIYAVTGIYAGVDINNSKDGTNNLETYGNLIGNAYNTSEGQLGSSTGNITGVYDLNGCVWEKVSTYMENSNGETYRTTYGATLVASTTSNKYRTKYSSSSSDTRTSNYLANSVDTIYGDAILETSTSDGLRSGWNSDCTSFPYGSSTFFVRGGAYLNEEDAGLFSFSHTDGRAYKYDGFRVVLISTS